MWFAGSDHAGLSLRTELVEQLREWGEEVEDFGTHNTESVDYPDYAKLVGKEVVAQSGFGLLVCGTGNGIAMSANKIEGVRAALCTNEFTASMARKHNDANVIVFGARVVGGGLAVAALRAFWEARFEGGRHQLRVQKMMGPT